MPRTARGLLDGGHDVRIGGATADVAAHPLADFRVGQRGMRDRQVLGDVARHAGVAFGQHADRRTDLSRCAVAALEAVMLDEGGLHRMQRFAVGQAFDGGDRLAVVHDRERQAGIDAPSVQQHGAGAALAVVAAFLRAGHRHMLAQRVQQCGARIKLQPMGMAVDLQRDVDRRAALGSIAAWAGRTGGMRRSRQAGHQQSPRDGAAGAEHLPPRHGQGYLRRPHLSLLKAPHMVASLFDPTLCGHVSSGRFTTMGLAVLRTTTQRKGSELDGLISMCGRYAGTWMKSPAFAVAVYSPLRAPADFAHALQHIGDRLLRAMVMDSGAGTGSTTNRPPHRTESTWPGAIAASR